MSDTMVILVDNEDNFLGYEEKEICHTGDGKHHRAITILLFNEKGQTLLQRRKHKRWDDVWDIAGATDVRHLADKDETYEEAGERCMGDEWSVVVPLEKVFGFNYFEKYGEMCENEFCMLLTGVAPDDIKYKEEVAYGQKWIDMQELAKEMEKNPKDFTPWALITIKEFLKRQ